MATYPTETYTNLKERFKSIAGLQSLETTDEAFFRQAINRRFRTAYQRYPWYEFTIVGEAVAMATADDNQIISYGANKDLANDADTIFRIHKQDPTDTLYPEEYTFISMIAGGSNPHAGDIAVKILSPTVLNSINAFVTYRKDVEDVVKDGSGTTGLYGDESGDTSAIPFRFFEYMAFGAYADFLRGDGQTQKAQVEDQNAEMILRQEIDIVRNQSRQFRHDVLQYRPQTQFRRHNLQAGGSPLNTTEQMFDNNVQ
jgi:hypothetical protein